MYLTIKFGYLAVVTTVLNCLLLAVSRDVFSQGPCEMVPMWCRALTEWNMSAQCHRQRASCLVISLPCSTGATFCEGVSSSRSQTKDSGYMCALWL